QARRRGESEGGARRCGARGQQEAPRCDQQCRPRCAGRERAEHRRSDSRCHRHRARRRSEREDQLLRQAPMNIAISAELAATVRTPPKIERIRISSREQWLKLRQSDVTASVAAALLGIHPYQTVFALWALKTGKISDDVEETPPMRRGKL